MTRQEKLKTRYRVVRNYTGDPDLARRARSWSDKRIFDELGIKVTKTVPKLRTYKPETYKKHELLILAHRQKRGKPKEIKKKKTKRSLMSLRKDKWTQWSKDNSAGSIGSFPIAIERTAQEMNMRARKEFKNREIDVNSRFGWGVTYESYIRGESPDKWYEKLKGGLKFFDPDFYRTAGRRKR